MSSLILFKLNKTVAKFAEHLYKADQAHPTLPLEAEMSNSTHQTENPL